MRRSALAAALVLAAGCGGERGNGTSIVLDTGGGSVTVQVEVADTPAERERGLAGRDALAADGGMVFLFPGPTTASFWMKDTLIPLSVAFLDERGRVVAIRDMTPCRGEPCPLYRAPGPYASALEVNRGAFRRWDFGVGDRVDHGLSLGD